MEPKISDVLIHHNPLLRGCGAGYRRVINPGKFLYPLFFRAVAQGLDEAQAGINNGQLSDEVLKACVGGVVLDTCITIGIGIASFVLLGGDQLWIGTSIGARFSSNLLEHGIVDVVQRIARR